MRVDIFPLDIAVLIHYRWQYWTRLRTGDPPAWPQK